MEWVREEILKSAQARSRQSRLLTADRYFRDMEACFSGVQCPENIYRQAEPGDWRRSLKDAEGRLVWTDGNATVTNPIRSRCGESWSGPAGSLLDFEAIVTTTRRDRDRDVMESKGADVDPSAVLLWQHIPMLPIGRLVSVTEQSNSHLKARLAIADTEMGRDAATLAEFGALKISHGFEPIEFEPLAEEGWHFKKFEIYEISLVSVPSNRDAVITAFSRDKLQSSLIKDWAGGLYRERPVQGRGAPGRFANPSRVATSRNHIGGSEHEECRCHAGGQDADQHGAAAPLPKKQTCAEAGAILISRAASATAEDIVLLKEIQGAIGQIIDYVEGEAQLTATKSFLRILKS